MSGADTAELKKELRAIKSELSENTKLTRETLDKVGDRLSKLEIAEAKRQGVESVTGSNRLDASSIVKIALAALGVASAAVSLALFIAQKVMQ